MTKHDFMTASRHSGIIAKKEFKGIMNEKTIILALLLQLFIAMFSSFLIVGLASMYDPDSLGQYNGLKYPVAYSGEGTHLLTDLRNDPSIVVYPIDLPVAVSCLAERQVAAVVWVPANRELNDTPVRATIYTIENDIQSGIVTAKLKKTLLEYETELREMRIDRLDSLPIEVQMPQSNITGGFYEFVYGILIPLLLLMPAIISGALIIDMITEEYQHNTLETLLSTPVSFTEIVWGKILTAFILVPLQAALWLVLLTLNGIPVGGIFEIICHISAVALILILIGAVFAVKYHERTNAQFIFSAAAVVLLIAGLAMPGNTGNIIVRLAVGNIGPEHWTIFLIMTAAALCLSAAVTKYAERKSPL